MIYTLSVSCVCLCLCLCQLFRFGTNASICIDIESVKHAGQGWFYARLRVYTRVSTDTLGVVDGYRVLAAQNSANGGGKTGFDQGI